MSKVEKSQRATDTEWKALYAAAAEIKRLAPWGWMTEDEIIGVMDPETGVPGYASVMGSLGEHFGISVYRGDEAMDGFWMAQELGEMGESPAALVMMLSQLQVSWEDREVLDKQDLAQIKNLKLKFRGRNEWPLFRATESGYAPWDLTKAEVRYLTAALKQVADVASRLAEDEELLDPPDALQEESDSDLYFFRVQDEDRKWRDEWRPIGPIGKALDIKIDANAFEAMKALPRSRAQTVEVGMVLMPIPLAEKRGDRPYYPNLFLIADAASGMILDFEMLAPIPSLEAMQLNMPNVMLTKLLRLGSKPQRVITNSPFIMAVMAELFREVGIAVELGETPAFEAALAGMARMMGMPLFDDMPLFDGFDEPSDESDDSGPDILRRLFGGR